MTRDSYSRSPSGGQLCEEGEPMQWYKRYSGRASNMKLFKAGFLGVTMFDALCDISCEMALDGRIPVKMLDPDWLAQRTMLASLENSVLAPGVSARELVQSGLDACLQESCGLVERQGEFLVITGWSDRQASQPTTSAQRMSKMRSKQAALFDVNGAEESVNTVDVTNVTEVTNVTDSRVDKRRVEKKRRSISPSQEVDGSDSSEKRPSAQRQLSDEMIRQYEQRRGEAYIFNVADGVALAHLLKIATPEKIVDRWVLAITTGDKWCRVSNVRSLRLKWNDLAGLKAISKPQLEDFTDKDPYAH